MIEVQYVDIRNPWTLSSGRERRPSNEADRMPSGLLAIDGTRIRCGDDLVLGRNEGGSNKNAGMFLPSSSVSHGHNSIMMLIGSEEEDDTVMEGFEQGSQT
ncbi:hypothetical protein V6N13_048327 [Hibiscus sabdariffa]